MLPDQGALSSDMQIAAHKFRAAAVFALEQRLGRKIREWPANFGPLVEMQSDVTEFAQLAPALAQTHSKRTSLYLAGCRAIEASLKVMLRNQGSPGGHVALAESKHINAPLFGAIAKKVGFTVPDGQLPDVLVKVKPEKIVGALRHGNEPLSPLALALLLSAGEDPGHPFVILARSRPSFLLELAEISDRRGHADDIRLADDEVNHVAENFVSLIESVLTVLD